MSVMDKLINAMKMNSDGDYYDEEDDYEDSDYVDEPQPSKLRAFRRNSRQDDEYDEQPAPRRSQAQPVVASRNQSRKTYPSLPTGNGMEVCIIKPTSFDEASELTDTLLSNRTVVLNLEGIDGDLAQRIIDFASGSCYAIRGNLQKISRYIFVITPESVDISGDISSSLGIDDNSGSRFSMPFAQN